MSKSTTDDYENVADVSDYSIYDPYGALSSALEQYGNLSSLGLSGLTEYSDLNSAMNAFLGQASGIKDLVSGSTDSLASSMNALAETESAKALQTVASSYNAKGAGRSGAAYAASSEAAAQPFAQALTDLGTLQTELTGNLWNTALSGTQSQSSNLASLYASLLGSGVSGYGDLATELGGVVAPQYEYMQSGWEKFTGGAKDAASTGLTAAQIAQIIASM
jgi:hypothetical protein